MSQKPDSKPERKPVRINVPLSGELHHRLRLRALDEDTTLAELVERLLREGLGLAPPPEAGEKGGEVRYPGGGVRAALLADRE